MKKTIIILLLFVLCFSVLYADKLNTKGINSAIVWNIVLVGVVVVFLSLLLIALIISLFRYSQVNEKRKTLESIESIPKKIASISRLSKEAPIPPMDPNLLTAIITTIFLHENEVENQSKMLLTMKRTKSSIWEQPSRLFMPNYVFHKNNKR